jgi:hypothetical protein
MKLGRGRIPSKFNISCLIRQLADEQETPKPGPFFLNQLNYSHKPIATSHCPNFEL